MTRKRASRTCIGRTLRWVQSGPHGELPFWGENRIYPLESDSNGRCEWQFYRKSCLANVNMLRLIIPPALTQDLDFSGVLELWSGTLS